MTSLIKYFEDTQADTDMILDVCKAATNNDEVDTSEVEIIDFYRSYLRQKTTAEQDTGRFEDKAQA